MVKATSFNRYYDQAAQVDAEELGNDMIHVRVIGGNRLPFDPPKMFGVLTKDEASALHAILTAYLGK